MDIINDFHIKHPASHSQEQNSHHGRHKDAGIPSHRQAHAKDGEEKDDADDDGEAGAKAGISNRFFEYFVLLGTTMATAEAAWGASMYDLSHS